MIDKTVEGRQRQSEQQKQLEDDLLEEQRRTA